ncbi:baseplate J/gp47 family protein [Cytobacillus praedii]|uniref:Baseplate J/gp47 family protein n=1 Tax=Cytobacillus praedii TaxID=1742358 RepID=A0A4R1AZA5_9BACI|nr:baseplate J/gp47 family protein [Cytobacillus praedii]TCJ04088.1 baseplate J/gp47 family protein [Cytobacillus praedii]
MYEHMTSEYLLDRMLSRVSANFDKRESSPIYTAIAPVAYILAEFYADLDVHNNLSFVDSADGEYLARGTSEHGINKNHATFAKRVGKFFGANEAPMDVPINSRFSIGHLYYLVESRLGLGEFILKCETAGTAGNEQFGVLLPVEYIAGLVEAQLADVLIPGENEEEDEALRERFFEEVNEEPFGGNVADYKKMFNTLDGIGGTKVFPAWQGGGSVKCCVLTSDFDEPTTDFIHEIQEKVDPIPVQGQGLGLAPMNHFVTITGAAKVLLTIESTITLANGVTIGQVVGDIEAILKDYFLSLRKNWKNEAKTIIRLSQIEARILTIPNIVDVTNTTINGSSVNVELDAEKIPFLDQVILNG